MKLKAKFINLSSGGPYVIALHHLNAEEIDVAAMDRVRITNGKKSVVAIVDVSHGLVKRGEVGLFLEVSEVLDGKENKEVEIKHEPKPQSLYFIKKKLDGGELKSEEIDEIIKDLVENTLTEIETTYFVAGCYKSGMSLQESTALTNAIVQYGGKLIFKKKPILDVHSVGGVPGNRISMVIVPIIAAAGFYIPKTSTRSITSPSGTSDTMEVLAPVGHSKEKIVQIVEKTNGAMVWGGTLDLASADDKLIKIERPLSLDPEGILLASIVAKKLAAGCTHVLLEIPIGKGAKFPTAKEGNALAKKFKALANQVGLKMKIILVDGSQPIGNGIGPALEAKDVLEVLEGRGPKDLRERSLELAKILLEMVNVKNAKKKVEEILNSGKALEKMREIIAAQGGDPKITSKDIRLGQDILTMLAKKSGKVVIHNKIMSRVAKTAGAPADKGAGIYLHKKTGQQVKKDEPLFTIYTENKEKLKEALKIAEETKPIEIL